MSAETRCHECGASLPNTPKFYRGEYSNNNWYSFCSLKCRSRWLIEGKIIYLKSKLKDAEKELNELLTATYKGTLYCRAADGDRVAASSSATLSSKNKPIRS